MSAYDNVYKSYLKLDDITVDDANQTINTLKNIFCEELN